jgi:hypothetical protein
MRERMRVRSFAVQGAYSAPAVQLAEDHGDAWPNDLAFEAGHSEVAKAEPSNRGNGHMDPTLAGGREHALAGPAGVEEFGQRERRTGRFCRAEVERRKQAAKNLTVRDLDSLSTRRAEPASIRAYFEGRGILGGSPFKAR